MTTKSASFGLQFSIALLVTGNLIGAGILGLPVIAGLCGLWPAFLVMVIFCLAMYYTACVIADETILARSATFNYPSLYHQYLGAAGKWIAIAANMLILYGLLTAYLTGGGAIILQALHMKASFVVSVLYFLGLTLLTVAGMAIIRRCNAGLVALMWISFLVIVILGALHIQPENFHHHDWLIVPLAIPVIVTSFHFHNIIPNVSEALAYDPKPIRRAMLMGMFFGLAMNALWLWVGIGVVDLAGSEDSLVQCYVHNIPATIPMSNVIHSRHFLLFAMIFSIIAIVTSYVANGLGLMGFSRDLLENYLHIKSPLVVMAVTFLPPFLIAQINPNIFLKAINFVGGYGIVVLFGILPCIIALIKKDRTGRQRLLALAILLLFVVVLLLQLGLDTQLLHVELPAH